MSLTNRFSALLLVTLGLTLAGFSTALFVSSRIYLDRQVDDRLAGILTLLNSSADTKHGLVRWDAREKRLPPNRWNERHATTWLVFDGEGRLLTHPHRLPMNEVPKAWLSGPVAGAGDVASPGRVTDRRGRTWRSAWRRVPSDPARDDGSKRPGDTEDEDKSFHREITLAAFASLEETEAALATLGWLLFGTSALVWTLAALSARWLSRQTLVPLTRLVEAVQGLDASKPGWALAELGTRDELDDLRRAFNDLLARLHEAYDRQRRFSSEASHQLRTPVAVLIGHLEVAQRHERTGDEYRRVIQTAHKRAVDLGQVVEALLFLGRPDSATLTRSEPIELGRWLASHMENRPPNGRQGDVSIRPSPDGPLWIEAQPQLLAQLVENLLDNACKYSRPGTPVVVAIARRDGRAALSVADAGIGIAPEDLPRVFEPFFRSSATGFDRPPGAGLGLSVVRRIAAAFGGTVGVESEPGKGSRFEVRFPVAPAPAPAPGPTPPPRPPAVAECARGR